MIANYGRAFAFVMKWEGGYVDDPDDPGGATKWGVAMNRLGRVLGIRDKEDLRGLTKKWVRRVFRARYWRRCACDELPSGIDLAVFDSAINQGQTRAAKLLQRAARVKADGMIGPRTLAAVRRADPHELLVDFMARRALHYSGLAKLWKYGFGWFRRLFDCHAAARELMSPQPVNHEGSTP